MIKTLHDEPNRGSRGSVYHPQALSRACPDPTRAIRVYEPVMSRAGMVLAICKGVKRFGRMCQLAHAI